MEQNYLIHFLLVLLHKRSSVYILSFHLSTHLERRAARVSWHDWIAFISSERFAIITRPQSKSQPASVDDSQMNNFCLLQDYYPGDGCRGVSLFNVFSLFGLFSEENCCCQRGEQGWIQEYTLDEKVNDEKEEISDIVPLREAGLLNVVDEWRENSPLTLSQL